MLEGEQALIVKIGLRETVFGTYGTNGYTWRYVPNERIQFLKLEKIINKDLHLDSDIEKGRRIQSLIDRAQDAYIKQNEEGIAKNKEDIENLKKGN